MQDNRSSGNPVIEVNRGSIRLGTRRILKGIDLAVHEGEILCVVGPSGSGKTTLLRCLSLLLLLDEGDIHVAGNPVLSSRQNYSFKPNGLKAYRDLLLFGDRERSRFEKRLFVPPHRHRQLVAMIFQEFNLWPTRTVLQNLLEGPVYAQGRDVAKVTTEARVLLENLGLHDMERRYPHQLSGGQRQRVAIARGMIMQPKVLLADEITSALDPELISEVLEGLRRAASSGVTMIVVTHHLAFARDVSDRVIVLANGEIVDDGSPARVLSNSSGKSTANFLRRLDVTRRISFNDKDPK